MTSRRPRLGISPSKSGPRSPERQKSPHSVFPPEVMQTTSPTSYCMTRQVILASLSSLACEMCTINHFPKSPSSCGDYMGDHTKTRPRENRKNPINGDSFQLLLFLSC